VGTTHVHYFGYEILTPRVEGSLDEGREALEKKSHLKRTAGRGASQLNKIFIGSEKTFCSVGGA